MAGQENNKTVLVFELLKTADTGVWERQWQGRVVSVRATMPLNSDSPSRELRTLLTRWVR